MTRINPNPSSELIPREDYEARFWMNQTLLPPTNDDIYNIPCRGRMFRVKKADYYPFGSVKGFVDEQEVMERFFYPHINKESIFFDVGACWGTYTLRALLLGAKVIAFEPDPRMINGLNDNIDLNLGFRERFILYEGALGHENATIQFDDLEDVPLATLDSFIDYKPTFVKIDVEWMESMVIQGAIKTMERYKPKLLIENHVYAGSHLKLSQELADRFIERTRKMVSIITSIGYKFEMGPTVGKTYFTFCY